MWNLTEDQYKAGFLSPAAAHFIGTGELPDVFSRFGLPLETEDEEDIRTAIRGARTIWSRQQHRNPKYNALLARLTLKSENDRAEAILLDREQRQRARLEIARSAAARLQKDLAELDRDIAAASADEVIDANILAKLRAKWKDRGIPEEDVNERVRVPVVHNKKVRSRLPDEAALAFRRQERDKITSCLRILGHPDIRGFLQVNRGAKPDLVVAAMRDARNGWDTKPPDGMKTAANHLLAVLNSHCASGELTAFDRWSEWEGVQKLKLDVSLFGTDKRIALQGFRLLVQRGVEYGLSESSAALFVEDLARAEGCAVEIPAHADEHRCIQCGTTNEPAAETCVNADCREPLKVSCQGCGERIRRAPQPCPHCGLDGAVSPQIQHALAAAKRDVSGKARVSARAHMDRAKALWANVVMQGAYQEVEHRLAELDQELSALVVRMQGHVAERQFFAAQQLLVAARQYEADLSTVAGRPLKELGVQVDRAVNAANAFLGEARRAEVSGGKGKAQGLYRQALAECSDCDAAAAGLRNCLPQAPASVSAAMVVGETAIRIEWMPTSDPQASYEVRRGTGAPVESMEAGWSVGSTSATSMVDSSVEYGCLYFYSVFGVSDGLASPAAISNSLLLHIPVSDLQITAGDGVVSGRWQLRSPTGLVQVLRRGAGLLKAFATPTPIATGQGLFEDRDAVNGQAYEYNVTVTYPLPGGAPIVRESGWTAATPHGFSLGCLGWLATGAAAVVVFILVGLFCVIAVVSSIAR